MSSSTLPFANEQKTHQEDSSTARFLANRVTWLQRIVAASFALELLLSWRLWTGPRTFPKLPLLDILPTLPFVANVMVFALMLVLLAGITVLPRPRVWTYTFLMIVALLAVDDQMFWHPFFYQYYFMLAALCFFAWSGKLENKQHGQQLAFVTCRWIVASIYVYAGLQKMNSRFLSDVFPWFIEPITHAVPSLQSWLLLGGFLVPFLEMSIGLGLLLGGYRRYAVAVACLMHLFILWMLGPLGHTWGSVVWPWNLSMMLLVYVLGWNIPNINPKPLHFRQYMVHKGILALFVVMPAFSFFNLWDSKLSSTMYSGNGNSAEFFISETLQKKLPSDVQKYTKPSDGELLLDYFNWSYQELNVIAPSETKNFKAIARYLCAYSSHPSDVTVVIQGKPTLFRADKPTTYTCAELNQ
jgi:uncharacterized membrane protein YphA (DoxX/SURF4 family)